MKVVKDALKEIGVAIARDDTPDKLTERVGIYAGDFSGGEESLFLLSGSIEELMEKGRLLHLPVYGWQGGGGSFEILIDD